MYTYIYIYIYYTYKLFIRVLADDEQLLRDPVGDRSIHLRYVCVYIYIYILCIYIYIYIYI